MMPACFFGVFMMRALIEILQDGQFHSGEELGAAIGVSRSAIWKQLQRLEADLGLTIHRVKGRGYQLAAPLRLLDSTAFTAAPWPVTVFDSLGSTNVEAQRQLAEGREPPFVVLAERQTAGRGRRGRPWVSPYAENIYFSLVFPVDGGARQLEGLSLVVGLAVRQALSALGVAGVGLKWPNDLLVGKKKIAGILLELSGDPGDRCNVVIGIGVNVNMRAAEDIDQPWTSLCMELGTLVERDAVALVLAASLQDYLARHLAHGFLALRGEWESHHLWHGCPVVLTAGERRIHGVVRGVDEGGALRLEVDGVEQLFSGGELSLRLADDS
jgi:BirA family biotin operon repressor/biotin-[acetyl-CoA-carboxylase] ligase